MHQSLLHRTPAIAQSVQSTEALQRMRGRKDTEQVKRHAHLLPSHCNFETIHIFRPQNLADGLCGLYMIGTSSSLREG